MTRENKNLLITFLILFSIALFATYYYWNKPKVSEYRMAYVLSASFVCSDQSYFTAEFPKDNEVEILVDGRVVRIVPMTADSGQKFENEQFVYTFFGEEAEVVSKADGVIVTCTQPVNSNHAPVNFGNRKDVPLEKQDLSKATSESMLGKWKSTQDEKFVREFRDDGIEIDYYDGTQVSTGNWKVFSKDKPLTTKYPLEANTSYVEITDVATPADNLYFKIIKVTPEELEMIYLDRGGVLTFTRVK